LSSSGTVLSARDFGSIWMLFYERDDGRLGSIPFGWRSFAEMYEAESRRSFYQDYAFGAGRDAIERYFAGRRVVVDGDVLESSVRFED
jgi:hypothetical protein